MRARSTSVKVEIAGNACAASAFVIRVLHHQQRDVRVASRRHGRERRCADSESQNLAMKKFSCLTPLSLLAAGRTVAFLRIAVSDSKDGGLSQSLDVRPMWSVGASQLIPMDAGADLSASSRSGLCSAQRA